MTINWLPKAQLVSNKVVMKYVSIMMKIQKAAMQLPLRITKAFLWYNLPLSMEKDSAGKECTKLRVKMVMTILTSSMLKET